MSLLYYTGPYYSTGDKMIKRSYYKGRVKNRRYEDENASTFS